MALKKFNFNVNHTENYSRVGVIETHRGNINTPAFRTTDTVDKNIVFKLLDN